ncbi:type II secretion system F family protein [Candidatus Parcubacteria bacterium]|nr:type II secretion system F family protein [Candidatus Parcubacteria bacterium]
MPNYFYTAKSLKGEVHSGKSEAKDEYELARILRGQGYILIKAETRKKSVSWRKKKKMEISLPFLGVSAKEKLFFTRNLRIMISAGMSLPGALNTLASVSENKKFKDALLKIKTEIIKGKSFSESLERFPNIFPELFSNMVRAGEESGTLEDVLKSLTRQIEREVELKSKIIGAMIYPAVIIVAMLGIGALMLVIVVPSLAAVFADLEMELPATTRFVIFLGTFMTERWYLFILILLVSGFLFRTALKTKKGKKNLDAFLLKIPVISSLVKKTNTAFTSRTLSSLISAGIPLVRGLEITSQSLNNFYYKKALLEAVKKVRKGEKLSDVLMSYTDIYPLIIVQMIKVGEETGETSEILEKMADFYEEEVSNATKNLSSIIEPVLMLIVGGAVGFFAVSMIQPMYSMMGAM